MNIHVKFDLDQSWVTSGIAILALSWSLEITLTVSLSTDQWALDRCVPYYFVDHSSETP